MKELVKRNDCNSDALKRFESNLYRFVENMEPLRLPGNPTVASLGLSQASSFTVGNLELRKLLDDLIVENSKAWVFNRYRKGSLFDIKVQSSDDKKMLYKVVAGYDSSIKSKDGKNKVVLTFDKNIPHCLYFSDAWDTCRHPSRKIVNDYERGRYLKK